MRVLFLAETPLSLTSFQSVITELAHRGHDVTIAIHSEREVGWRDSLLAEVEATGATIERAVRWPVGSTTGSTR